MMKKRTLFDTEYTDYYFAFCNVLSPLTYPCSAIFQQSFSFHPLYVSKPCRPKSSSFNLLYHRFLRSKFFSCLLISDFSLLLVGLLRILLNHAISATSRLVFFHLGLPSSVSSTPILKVRIGEPVSSTASF